MKKRMYLPLLITLALTGALLLTSCYDSDNALNKSSYPANTAEYYKNNQIALPDDFYRPDLIWNWESHVIPNAVTADLPNAGEVVVRFDMDYFSNVGENDRYAVAIVCYDNCEERGGRYEPIDYLTNIGWELVSRSQDNGQEYTACFAATRTEIETLNPIDLQAFYGYDELPGIFVLICGQSIS